MTIEFKNLHQRTQDLLMSAKDQQLNFCEKSNDSRGYYAEFDSENCKPYTHIHILEIQELEEKGVVTIHEDSDTAHELGEPEIEVYEDDDGEEWEEEIEDSSSGVCFVKINKDFLDLIPDYE